MGTFHSFKDISQDDIIKSPPERIQWDHLHIKYIFEDEHERYARYLEGVIETKIQECLECVRNICTLLKGSTLLRESGFNSIGKKLPNKKQLKLIDGVDFLKKVRGCSIKLNRQYKGNAKDALGHLDRNTLREITVQTTAIEQCYQTLKHHYEDSIDRIRQFDIAVNCFYQYQELLKDNISKINTLRSINEISIGKRMKKGLGHQSEEKWLTFGELQSIIQNQIEGVYWYRMNPSRLRTLIEKTIENNDGKGFLKGRKKGIISQDRYSVSLLNEVKVKAANDIPSSGAVKIIGFKNSDELYLFTDFILNEKTLGFKMALEIKNSKPCGGQVPLIDYLMQHKSFNELRIGGPRHYYFTRIMIDDLWAIFNNEEVRKEFATFKTNANKGNRLGRELN